MPENRMKKPHLLTLDNRRLLTLTGVEDVSGFDEQTINVRLSEMTLVVKGTGLHISKLNLESGDVVIDGSISSLQYLGSSSGSLRSRLFRRWAFHCLTRPRTSFGHWYWAYCSVLCMMRYALCEWR